MEYPKILKVPIEQYSVKPNLENYEKIRQEFNWDQVSRELDWFDSGHINIAHIAVDAHLKTGRG